MTPKRVQLRRTKGWRLPAGTVVVSRPTRWGNPLRWNAGPTIEILEDGHTAHGWMDRTTARAISVRVFREMLADPQARALNGYPSDDEIREQLAGKDLACWCPLDGPCHADVLLDIANGGAA